MIHEPPRWTYESRGRLTQWYGHVQLLPDRALGQWFCVDRASGALLWRRTYLRPNSIHGIESGVIVASEGRTDGPYSADYGCYGLSLETGRLLWTSHGSGFWKFALRALDFVPGYTNEFRDDPVRAQDGKVFCRSGRVLDARTGATIDRVKKEASQANEQPQSDGQLLYDGKKVRLASGLSLHFARRPAWELVAERESGEVAWRAREETLGGKIDGNFYSFRLAGDCVYAVVSEEPAMVPHPTKAHYAVPNPTRWHLVAIDVATGELVQDVRLDDEKRPECRIEDLDATGLLISAGRELKYFERTG